VKSWSRLVLVPQQTPVNALDGSKKKRKKKQSLSLFLEVSHPHHSISSVTSIYSNNCISERV
jgi:hypothetical protein